MKWKNVVLSLFCVLSGAMLYSADPVVGKKAPAFRLTDTHGKIHALSDHKGRWVVLEWTNPDCPFVKKHYDSGNMQSLQKAYTDKGVVWLSVCSSAPGKQGHYSPAEWTEILQKQKASSTALLLDPEGTVGRLYSAKTTPHMYVINPKGLLIYQGAIDDKATTDPEDIKDSKNYVKAVLDAALAGQAVPVSSTTPYGCSVKYK